ncbi:Six-hairpin glycosidase [Aspergillus pseudodeflectus]|uniref:Six-hairpin glycosidase n=1 Tax=Aspergillus pseudodeflectus TaxID=176178 RepID=A0ABR4KV19_9EURO
MLPSLYCLPRLLVCILYIASCSAGLTLPASYSAKGNDFNISDSDKITLSSDGNTPSVIVLDYGRNVEGYPTFKVVHRRGNTSAFEMSYAECLSSLDSYMSDGPITLSAAMDNYRVNHYNISGTSYEYKNRLIQGGLRYQKLNLSSAGELTLTNVGFVPTVDDTPIAELPGSFRSSDPVLNRIWEVGARTVQLNEFPANSLPHFWTITEEGALVESQAPQPFSSDYAPVLTAYDLSFAVKAVKNGFGFTVLSDTLGSGVYIFVNIANSSISAHAGATELDSEPLARAMLPSSVAEDLWHQVSSTVDNGHIQVSIDGSQLLDFTQGGSLMGSFGLGASFNQAAVFTNLSLIAFGTTIYSSKLNDKYVLQDFLLGTNPLPVSVDGSRRDRIAYAGDLDIATASAFASTAGHEYVNGSISLLGSFQMTPGFFIPTAKVQQPPRTTDIPANITGLIGYSFNLVSAMSRYYQQTGDRAFLSEWAPKAVRLFDWADSQLLPNGLLNISNPAMGGDWNYYDPQVGGVVAKFNLVYAYALAESLPFLADAGLNTTTYTGRLRALKSAINEHLWSDELHAYYHSESYPEFISQEANALAILSNTIPTDSGNRSVTGLLASMSQTLNVPAGVLAFSPSAASSGWRKKISPYASGYHLKAAFQAHDAATAKHLLNTIWGPMSNPQNANYTGCFWEVLNKDGTPGLGLGTSLCHAWAAGPTADLSRYVLGIAPVTPGFVEWKVEPQTLDLEWAQGRHPVPQGAIGVNWKFDDKGLLSMAVTSPHRTSGTVYLPSPLKRRIEKYRVIGGRINKDGSFNVHGRTFIYQQIA